MTESKKDCFFKDCDKGKTKKKKKKKYPKSQRVKSSKGRNYYGGGMYGHNHDQDSGGDGGGGDGGGGMGESVESKGSFITELLNGSIPGTFSSNVLAATAFGQNKPSHKLRRLHRLGNRFPSDDANEEDAEVTPSVGGVGNVGGGSGNKIDQARQLFQSLINRPDMNRQAMIQQFQDQVGVTDSTAVSYYERLAKEAGLTNQDDRQDLGQSVDMRGAMPPQGQPVDELPADQDNQFQDQIEHENPDRAGVIRTVDGAHLVYKRQTEDGSFEELWLYNTGNSVTSELEVRRDILAGTDIPPKGTKSPDGSQYYSITTLGNAQYLNVHGLPN